MLPAHDQVGYAIQELAILGVAVITIITFTALFVGAYMERHRISWKKSNRPASDSLNKNYSVSDAVAAQVSVLQDTGYVATLPLM